MRPETSKLQNTMQYTRNYSKICFAAANRELSAKILLKEPGASRTGALRNFLKVLGKVVLVLERVVIISKVLIYNDVFTYH